MEKYPNLTLAVLFVVPLLLGALQGADIQDIKRTELFYRWLISAGERMESSPSIQTPKLSADDPDPQDDALFQSAVAVAEQFLPAESGDEPGRRLISAVTQRRDAAVWKMARSSESAAILDNFYSHIARGELQSASRMMTIGDIWNDPSAANDGTQIYDVGLTSVFFGFRKLAANLLWLQVDTFFHRGEMHRMPSLMRTCVMLDPNFIDAYLLGAWHLAYNITAKIPMTPEANKVWYDRYQKRLGDKEIWYYRAADFLRDGIWDNPRDYRLYFDLGYSVYEVKMKDHGKAVEWLEQATRQKHDVWVRRMLLNSLKNNAQFEDAVAGWEDYIRDFPHFVTGPRSLTLNQGYLAEVRSEDALACANAAEAAAEEAEQLLAKGNAPDAEALQARVRDARASAALMRSISEEEDAKAVAIWNGLIEDGGGDDPEAQVRLDRREAIQWHEDGKYREAIGRLEAARFESTFFFEEASDLIIAIKQQATAEGKKIALTLSEAKAVIRKKEAAVYLEGTEKEPLHRFDCEWLDPPVVANVL